MSCHCALTYCSSQAVNKFPHTHTHTYKFDIQTNTLNAFSHKSVQIYPHDNVDKTTYRWQFLATMQKARTDLHSQTNTKTHRKAQI